VKLTIGEAASLLGSSAERVTDWIEEAGLRAERIRGQYRINRTDLLEWATEHDVRVAPRAFGHDRGAPSLGNALRAGGIHDRIGGPDVATLVGQIVELLPLVDAADRDELRHILQARKALGVTPVGGGIAIPHVRTPIILAPVGAVLALSYLSSPLDLQVPDGQAIDTLFLLICPTVHTHLAMLARLAYALKDEAFRSAVVRRAPADDILRIADALEEEL
jgi:nitrogen PTS system EIIA component